MKIKKDDIIQSIKIISVTLIFFALIFYGLFYKADPSMYGCVYESNTGKKIACVEYKFNEKDNPGSMQEALNYCINELESKGIKTGHPYDIEGCIVRGGF